MKLLTLNTHSLIEKNYFQKLRDFVILVQSEQPDVIALQEVNQTAEGAAASQSELTGYVPCPDVKVPIRPDNHAAAVAKLLEQSGAKYSWCWLPMKLGYGRYDEGMAVFSRSPILEVDSFRISDADDYHNWKTRYVLGIRTGNGWFYTVHMGWWADEEEPFRRQWLRLNSHLQKRENVWLMGDFNSSAGTRGEGYDLIRKSDWQDTYELAGEKDEGYTVEEVIDGWRDAPDADRKMRIDQIWCDRPRSIRRSQVVFDGKSTPRVSDHYGVMVVTD